MDDKAMVALVERLRAVYDGDDPKADIGIYPAAVKGFDDERDYEQRDGFKNGWNAAVMEYGRAIDSVISEAATLIEQQAAELEQCRKDAERYRFVRSGEYSLPDEGTWRTEKGALLLGGDLDMAVDRTMSGETE
jgi:hypothetical protein